MDKEENAVVPTLEDDSIRSRILTVRGVQVMLDRDLAELYGVQTKVLNQAVKRNSIRFPANFMFPLNDAEIQGLFIKGTNVLNRSRSQIVTLNKKQAPTLLYHALRCGRPGPRFKPQPPKEDFVGLKQIAKPKRRS